MTKQASSIFVQVLPQFLCTSVLKNVSKNHNTVCPQFLCKNNKFYALGFWAKWSKKPYCMDCNKCIRTASKIMTEINGRCLEKCAYSSFSKFMLESALKNYARIRTVWMVVPFSIFVPSNKWWLHSPRNLCTTINVVSVFRAHCKTLQLGAL